MGDTLYTGTAFHYDVEGDTVYKEITNEGRSVDDVISLFKKLAREGEYEVGDGLQIFECQYAEEENNEFRRLSIKFYGECTIVRPGMVRVGYGTHS